jgi:hypothetical protein
MHRPAAQPVGGNIRCNPVKPSRGIRIASEARQRFRCLFENSLSQIFGVLRTDNTSKNTPDALMVCVIQNPKNVRCLRHIQLLMIRKVEETAQGVLT